MLRKGVTLLRNSALGLRRSTRTCPRSTTLLRNSTLLRLSITLLRNSTLLRPSITLLRNSTLLRPSTTLRRNNSTPLRKCNALPRQLHRTLLLRLGRSLHKAAAATRNSTDSENDRALGV